MAKPRHYRQFRRFIRINGKLQPSPRFSTKKAADDWYNQTKDKLAFVRQGLAPAFDEGSIPTFGAFAAEWLAARIAAGRPASTWADNERSLRIYLLPAFSEIRLDRISTQALSKAIKSACDERPTKEGAPRKRPISDATKKKLKALASAIFKAARQHQPPYLSSNPARDVDLFNGRKPKAAKKPVYLEHEEDCLAFLQEARRLSLRHLAVSGMGMMAGLRKCEMAAVQWADLDPRAAMLRISRIVEQETLTIQPRTKRGEACERYVPVSAELMNILMALKAETAFAGPSDFILVGAKGRFLSPRSVYDMIQQIVQATGRPMTVHGLRHTYGRQFAKKSGNMKALQDILGHSTMATTEIYSKLGGSHLKEFSDAVSFGLGAVKPTADTTMTPQRSEHARNHWGK